MMYYTFLHSFRNQNIVANEFWSFNAIGESGPEPDGIRLNAVTSYWLRIFEISLHQINQYNRPYIW